MVDGEWNNRFLCTMMPDVISCLRRDLALLKPDFILLTGDIANHQTRDVVFAARDLIDSLGVPYFPMGGNHDFVIEESRPWFLDAFKAHVPQPDTVYSFTHKNLHFCVLDAWWKWRDDSLCPLAEKAFTNTVPVSMHGARWSLPPHEFAWLEDDLTAHQNLPTIMALHYPVTPVPKHMRRPGMKDAGHLDNGDMVLEMLSRHPQVKAILTGHVHMHFIERWNGITHVTTGAMPEFPCEYRDIQVHNDRLEVRTCSLSDGVFAERSLIPGKDWTAGSPEDRSATIRLL